MSLNSIIRKEKIPVYKQISRRIKNLIDKQSNTDTVSLIPERELSKIFKVTRTTVRRALTELKNKNIIEPRRKFGNLISTKKGKVCLSINRLSRFNHTSIILDTIEEFFQRKGYEAIECLNYSLNAQLEILNRERDNVDGFIIYPNIEMINNRVTDAINKILSVKIPVVLINTDIPGTKADFVGANEINGSIDATDFLIKKGCKDIIYLSSNLQKKINSNRENGYLKSMEKHGLKPKLIREEIQYDYVKTAYDVTKRLIKNNKKIEAIMCINDMTAVGVFNALREKGVAIGKDIYIFGFGDDIEMHAYFNFELCPISSVAIPRYDMGETSAKFLINKLDGTKQKNEIQRIELKTNLVLRNSTGE